MEIHTTSVSGVPLLFVSGDVDHLSAPALEAALAPYLFSVQPQVALELRSCPYVDSGGLAVILRAVGELGPGGWLGVVGADQNLGRLFEIVGLLANSRFRVFADEEELAGHVSAAASVAPSA